MPALWLLVLMGCEFGRVYYPDVGSNGLEWTAPGEVGTGGGSGDDTSAGGDEGGGDEGGEDTGWIDGMEYGVFPVEDGDVLPCDGGPRSDIGPVTVFNRLDVDVEVFSVVVTDCSEERVGPVAAGGPFTTALYAHDPYIVRDTSGAARFWFRVPDTDTDVVLEAE